MKDTMVTYEALHPGGPAPEEPEMLLVCCPGCGYRISESGSGTKSKQMCPRCGAELGIEVVGVVSIVRLIQKPKKPRTPRKEKAPNPAPDNRIPLDGEKVLNSATQTR